MSTSRHHPGPRRPTGPTATAPGTRRTAAPLLGAAAICAALGTGAAACNAVFGIEDGILGTGGAGGSGASGGSGGCSDYAGDGTVSWTATGSADFMTGSYDPSGSIMGGYDPSSNVTNINLSGDQGGFWCGIRADVNLSGKPVAGQTYTVTDRTAFADVFTFAKGNNAYVTLSSHLPGDGGCGTEQYAEFGSVAGVAGATVTVTQVQGTRVDFTVTSAQLTAYTDPGDVGTGTLTLSIDAHADCFSSP